MAKSSLSTSSSLMQHVRRAAPAPFTLIRPHRLISIPSTSRPLRSQSFSKTRSFHTFSSQLASSPSRAQPGPSTTSRSTARPAKDLSDPDRGPVSKEDTQTDFSTLNVLGGTVAPTTSVDVVHSDGFQLDSGLRIGDGNGVLLVGSEAFVWRPWMAGTTGDVVDGEQVRAKGDKQGAAGVLLNKKGQFELRDEAWGVLSAVWPRPDLLIIGTGPSIRPLAPATRKHLEDLGLRIDVLDTRNAAATFNLLATERGTREVAAALVPVGYE